MSKVYSFDINRPKAPDLDRPSPTQEAQLYLITVTNPASITSYYLVSAGQPEDALEHFRSFGRVGGDAVSCEEVSTSDPRIDLAEDLGGFGGTEDPDLSCFSNWIDDMGLDHSWYGSDEDGNDLESQYEAACNAAGVTPDWE